MAHRPGEMSAACAPGGDSSTMSNAGTEYTFMIHPSSDGTPSSEAVRQRHCAKPTTRRLSAVDQRKRSADRRVSMCFARNVCLQMPCFDLVNHRTAAPRATLTDSTTEDRCPPTLFGPRKKLHPGQQQLEIADQSIQRLPMPHEQAQAPLRVVDVGAGRVIYAVAAGRFAWDFLIEHFVILGNRLG